MSLFCTRNIILALIGLVGFFPYMPLVHAESSGGGEGSHCVSHEERSTHSGWHDMKLCLDIVNAVSYSHISASSEVFVSATHFWYIFPYWEVSDSLELKTLQKISSHTLDPPYFTSHSLVGIVKLTN